MVSMNRRNDYSKINMFRYSFGILTVCWFKTHLNSCEPTFNYLHVSVCLDGTLSSVAVALNILTSLPALWDDCMCLLLFFSSSKSLFLHHRLFVWARPAHESVVPLHAVALQVTSAGQVALV